MIKDIMTKNEHMTPNEREMAVLKENFPSCFRVDGSFDLARFSEFLKDKIDVSHEGYELKFLGKSYAKMLASLDTETVIVPDDAHIYSARRDLVKASHLQLHLLYHTF